MPYGIFALVPVFWLYCANRPDLLPETVEALLDDRNTSYYFHATSCLRAALTHMLASN